MGEGKSPAPGPGGLPRKPAPVTLSWTSAGREAESRPWERPGVLCPGRETAQKQQLEKRLRLAGRRLIDNFGLCAGGTRGLGPQELGRRGMGSRFPSFPRPSWLSRFSYRACAPAPSGPLPVAPQGLLQSESGRHTRRPAPARTGSPPERPLALGERAPHPGRCSRQSPARTQPSAAPTLPAPPQQAGAAALGAHTGAPGSPGSGVPQY